MQRAQTELMDRDFVDPELFDPERECGNCMGPVELLCGAGGRAWVCIEGCGASWSIPR